MFPLQMVHVCLPYAEESRSVGISKKLHLTMGWACPGFVER
jgi:hypothetical protein